MELETIDRTAYKSKRKRTGSNANGNIGSLYQQDDLICAQYFDRRGGNTWLSPEKRLMLAVLEDAITCFQENYRVRCGKRKKLFDAVQEWFFGATDWVFGFENICSALGYDPGYIRAGLIRWREQEIAKHPAGVWKHERAASDERELANSGRTGLQRRQVIRLPRIGPKSNMRAFNSSI